MKIRKRKSQPTINRVFTDREESRAAFWESYNSCKQNIIDETEEIKVLTYYGVGGVGKSALLKKLQEEMSEKILQPKYVYYDLGIANDCRTVLESIKNKLADDYNFDFTLFELGVYAYGKKIGANKNEPEAHGFIPQSPLLNFAIETLGMLPVADIGVQMLKLADAGYAFAKKLYEENRSELENIETLLPQELYEYLPYLFIQDMYNNLENAKEPLVIFLDTYEALVNELSSVGEPLTNDLWIRGEDGLVLNIPNVLWVVAGREKLKWERFNTEKIHWEEALEQHLLGSFSRSDAYFFLESAGITDKDLQHDLYNLTEGSPVYLNLCVDTYYSLIRDGETPKIEAFGQDVTTLIKRFAGYMDANSRCIVNMLTCLKFWDEAMVKAIAPKVIHGFNEDIYDNVKKLSFIRQTNDDNYVIHQTVGDVLFKFCSESMRNAVIEHAVKYSMDKLEEHNLFDPIYHYHLNWLMKFGLRNFELDEFVDKFFPKYIVKSLDELLNSSQVSITETIYLPFLNLALNYDANSKVGKVALWIRAIIEYYKCNYDYALNLFERILATRREEFGEKHNQTIIAKGYVASILLSLNRCQEALPLYKEIYEVKKERCGEKNPDTINAMGQLAIAFMALDRDEEALNLQKQVVSLTIDAFGAKHPDTIKAIQDLARLLLITGKEEEYLVVQNRAIELCKEVLGEKNPETINSINKIVDLAVDLARDQRSFAFSKDGVEVSLETVKVMNELVDILFGLERYQEALDLQREVVEFSKEALSEKHYETIKTINRFDSICSGLERNQEDLDLQKKVEALRRTLNEKKEHPETIIHPETVKAMNKLAEKLFDLERYQEALEFQEKVVEIDRETLGEKHYETIKAMNKLADKLFDLERYQEALGLQRKVVEISRETLGEKHDDTINAIGNIAKTYFCLEDYEQALQLKEYEVKLRKETLGEKHDDTIYAMRYLVAMFFELNTLEKAVVLQKRVCELLKESKGENDYDTIEAMEDLARILEASGSLEDANSIRSHLSELEIEDDDVENETDDEVDISRLTSDELLELLASDEELDEETIAFFKSRLEDGDDEEDDELLDFDVDDEFDEFEDDSSGLTREYLMEKTGVYDNQKFDALLDKFIRENKEELENSTDENLIIEKLKEYAKNMYGI